MTRLAASIERGGFLLWASVTLGIWAWTVHILLLASIVEPACDDGAVEWVAHGATAATGVATAVALAICARLARGDGDDDAGTVPARTRFLGRFGVLVNGVSLLLIALEGAYVPFLDPCA